MFFEWIELLKVSNKVNQTSKQYKFKRIPRTLWNAKLLDRYFDRFSVTEFFNLFPIDFVLNLHIIFRARSPHLNFRVNVIPSNINFNPFNNWSGCAEYFPMRVNGEIKFEDWCGCSSSAMVRNITGIIQRAAIFDRFSLILGSDVHTVWNCQ